MRSLNAEMDRLSEIGDEIEEGRIV